MRRPVDPCPLPDPVATLFRSPAHAGAPATPAEPAAARWVHGEAGRRRDGAQLRFHLQVDAAGRVLDARFQAYGCPWTVAAAEWLAARLPGRSVSDLLPGAPPDWASALAVPVERLGRLLVIEDALRAAGRAAGGVAEVPVGAQAGPAH
jgi:nitrogen fixation NifU-like protein